VIRIADEVREARAVVALETTLVAHGFPPGDGVAVGLAAEQSVREAGAVPATIGVLDGEIVVGLSESELARFDASSRKLGPRDLAPAAVQRAVGATTVGGTLAVCAAAGIRFLATGGLGGVHRRVREMPEDVSADLHALARTQALVVSAGVKSLLDVPATVEALETLGVPVLGFRTDALPLFYSASGGPPVSARVESAREAASVAAAHWQLGGEGVLLARPPDESIDVEPLIEAALRAAEAEGVRGGPVTPFVLAYLHRESGGRTLAANRELVIENARLAAEVAVASSTP
jgi:pseudouridine-5'-phosphate glycosidase